MSNLRACPRGTVVKNLPANAGDPRDLGSIPGSQRSPGEGNGNSLQYSCLENSMDRGDSWATVHGVRREEIFFMIQSVKTLKKKIVHVQKKIFFNKLEK